MTAGVFTGKGIVLAFVEQSLLEGGPLFVRGLARASATRQRDGLNIKMDEITFLLAPSPDPAPRLVALSLAQQQSATRGASQRLASVHITQLVVLVDWTESDANLRVSEVQSGWY